MQNLHLNIFNSDLVEEVEPTFNLAWEDIEKGYTKLFEEYSIEDINLVFMESDLMQDLNRRYRDVDAPTDVLSFEITEDKKMGEIYICPEYVYETYKEDAFEEEILRLIIHGTLHILGYDHKESLNDNPNEEMFQIQEKLLVKFKNICS